MKTRILLFLLLYLGFSINAYCQLSDKSQKLEDSIKEKITDLSDPIEGIYSKVTKSSSPYYRIGIYKDGGFYRAVIIESSIRRWKVGDTKATFEPIGNLSYSVTWSMADRSVEHVFAKINDQGQLSIEFSNQYIDDILLLKLYPQVTTVPEKKQPNIINTKPKQSIVASGTGFFVSKDGYIATNYHVVKGAEKITVSLIDNSNQSRDFNSVVVKKDKANDIAILKIEDHSFLPFNVLPYTIESRINVGASVYTIGYPLNSIMGTNFKVSDGIISAKTGIEDDVRYFQITVPIQPGNSGGPLINKDGNVVGITSSQLNGEYIGAHVENVNYAIKAVYLLNVLSVFSVKLFLHLIFFICIIFVTVISSRKIFF